MFQDITPFNGVARHARLPSLYALTNRGRDAHTARTRTSPAWDYWAIRDDSVYPNHRPAVNNYSGFFAVVRRTRSSRSIRDPAATIRRLRLTSRAAGCHTLDQLLHE